MTEPQIPKPPKLPSVVVANWTGDQTFVAGVPGGPTIAIDGRRGTGPSPVDTLLIALAGCTSIDVVEILKKRQTPVESLQITVTGQRATTTPARVSAVLLEFRMKGTGIDRAQAERAIDLSVTKYCSVRDTLDRDMPIEWTLDLDNA